MQPSVPTAARLLDQATFGPTINDIYAVRTIGIDTWLKVQFATAPTLLPMLPSSLPKECPDDPTPCFESEFWEAALTAPDQLRHRVAFTLGEIFVTSTQSVNAYVMVPYYNMLAADAFSNWRTIMEHVTRSPAMGMYLNMLDSGRAATGQHANENFAREMLQLFSLGLYKLNSDGTQRLDVAGNTIPTFTEAQVQAFADAYTGWTYATAQGGAAHVFPNPVANLYYPLAGVDAAHDTSQKALLNGTVIPAGGSAAADLRAALDNIFNDPSLPPFVCRGLIQHLVASNPSKSYVGRVAAVFVNNGAGVRGDMKAVLSAILTDEEARAGDADPSHDGGHLREPMLYLASAMRSLGFSRTNTDSTNLWPYMSLSNETLPLGEQPMRSPSVFNFYAADYVLPGSGTPAPEFSLENTATVALRMSLADRLASGKLNGFAADFSKGSTLGQLAADPAGLTDVLGLLLMHSQMPTGMRQTIVSALTSVTSAEQRVRIAAYLILSSSDYKILH